MKTINTNERRVGYMIRRDVKDSYLKVQGYTPKQFQGITTAYFHPLVSGYSKMSFYISTGWSSKLEAEKKLQEYLKNMHSAGINVHEKYDYKIVKITIAEQDV